MEIICEDCNYVGPAREGGNASTCIIDYYCPKCGKWFGDKDVS